MNSSLKLSPMRNMLEEKYTIVTAKSAPFLMPFNETSKSTANLWSTISKNCHYGHNHEENANYPDH